MAEQAGLGRFSHLASTPHVTEAHVRAAQVDTSLMARYIAGRTLP